MTWDGNIVVNALSGAPQVDRAVFNVANKLFEGAEFAVGSRIRYYDDVNDSAGDADLSATEKAAAASAFSQDPAPPRVAISRTTQTAADFDNATADLALIRAEVGGDAWYGLNSDSRDEAVILSLGVWAEANGKAHVPQSSDAAILLGTAGNVAEDLQGFSYARTGLLYHAVDAEHGAFAWAAKTLSADPDIIATIWAYKLLAGITVGALTPTELGFIESQDCNAYLTLGGVGSTGMGVMADGTKMDELITKDWFKARAEERTAQVLLDASNRNSKVPFTDKGLEQLMSPVRSLLLKGEGIGHFEPDSTSVGDAKVEDFSVADKAARQATFAATAVLAGAIEKVTWNVAVLQAA